MEFSVTTSLSRLASTGSQNRFHIWSCLLCTHIPTFQQFIRVLQALCCSPPMHSQWLHASLWLPIALIPLLPSLTLRQNRCIRPGSCVLLVLFHAGGSASVNTAICLEELGDVLSRGTSGLWVDRRGSGMAPVLGSRQAQTGKSYLYLFMLVLTCPIRLTTWEPTSFHPCMC